MLDVYWRLHGKDELFFIPYDLEMSNQELSYIVNKAEAWRGEEGERRKVAVFDYIWEEEDVSYCIKKKKLEKPGPIVQSIINLTSLLRGQLIKCFTTL